MDTLNLSVQYRPIRIGWCVRNGNLEDYKKALKFTHTLWGGRFNPIIPSENIEFASQLVRLFKVDVLFPIYDSEEIKILIKQFPYLPWPIMDKEKLFIQGSHGLEPAFLDVYHAVRMLRSNLIKEDQLSKVTFNFINWEPDDPLALIFLAKFGNYPKADSIEIDYDTIISRYLESRTIEIKKDDPLPKGIFRARTRNLLTIYQLRKSRSLSRHESGFFFGDSQNFDDLVSFWNLNAAGVNLYFYDQNYSDRLNSFRDAYLSELSTRPKDDRRPKNYVALWGQKDKLDGADLSEFGKDIVRSFESKVVWNGLNIIPQIVHFEETSVLANISSSDEYKKATFQLPLKPIHEDTAGSYQHFVVTIRSWSDIRDESYTFKPFYLPKLNEFYGRNLYFQWDRTRVEPDGLGIIIETFTDSITLCAVNVRDLIENLFAAFGMKTRPSQAGLKTDRLINQMGGIQSGRVFKIAGVRDLIEKYKPQDSFKKSAAVQAIGQNDPSTGVPDFSKYEQLFIVERPIGAKLKPHDVFKYLVGKNVFRVGLKLRCSVCELEFWKSLDDVKAETICEFCGKRTNITPQLSDRDWAYRRSGIFGLEDNQAGGIPVALTLQQLDSWSGGLSGFKYVSATEILPDGADINKCESDFILVSQDHEGKISLILSECKTRGEITDEDVNNLAKVAEAFPVDQISIYVVFSKLTAFSEAEIERCKKAQGKYRNRAIMFTDRELEGWFIYEETEKIFDIDKHAVTWGRLAQNTVTIFFEKKLKEPEQKDVDSGG